MEGEGAVGKSLVGTDRRLDVTLLYIQLLIVLLITLIFAGNARAQERYMLTGMHGGWWMDADKSSANHDDDLLCWAAVAGNLLSWGGWTTDEEKTTDEIFRVFQRHWSDQNGNVKRALEWWFDGIDPEEKRGWAGIDEPGGGDYWPEYDLSDFFEHFNYYKRDGTALMPKLAELLSEGYAVGMGIIRPGSSAGHNLTVWGYTLDDDGEFSGVYVTDSDDKAEMLEYYAVEKYYSQEWDEYVWRFKSDGRYGNWFLIILDGLLVNPHAEPARMQVRLEQDSRLSGAGGQIELSLDIPETLEPVDIYVGIEYENRIYIIDPGGTLEEAGENPRPFESASSAPLKRKIATQLSVNGSEEETEEGVMQAFLLITPTGTLDTSNVKWYTVDRD